MRNERNVRFWVYVNGGPVKLTLKPDQLLTHESGHATDEGYRTESTTWMLDPYENLVLRQWWTFERDCDGPLERSGEDSARYERLRWHEPYVPGDNWPDEVMWPDWEHMKREQRDYFAEQMRY